MSNISIRQIPSVQRYANALFQLSKEAKVVDSVSKDLQNLKEGFNVQIRLWKYSPDIDLLRPMGITDETFF